MKQFMLGLSLLAVSVAAASDLWVALRPGLSAVSARELTTALQIAEAQAPKHAELVHSPLLGFPELKALGQAQVRPTVSDSGRLQRRPVVVLDRVDVPLGFLGRADRTVPVGDKLQVRIFKGSVFGQPVLFDLRELSQVSVGVRRGQRQVTCDEPRPGGGWRCPSEPEWMYVAPRTLKVDGQSEVCVWSHPPSSGFLELNLPPTGRATASTSSTTPSSDAELVLRAALDDSAVKTVGGAAVVTEVFQDGRRLGRISRDNREGWATGRFPVSSQSAVRLTVRAARDGARHHCLDVQIVEPR